MCVYIYIDLYLYAYCDAVFPIIPQIITVIYSLCSSYKINLPWFKYIIFARYRTTKLKGMDAKEMKCFNQSTSEPIKSKAWQQICLFWGKWEWRWLLKAFFLLTFSSSMFHKTTSLKACFESRSHSSISYLRKQGQFCQSFNG